MEADNNPFHRPAGRNEPAPGVLVGAIASLIFPTVEHVFFIVGGMLKGLIKMLDWWCVNSERSKRQEAITESLALPPKPSPPDPFYLDYLQRTKRKNRSNWNTLLERVDARPRRKDPWGLAK